MSLVETATNDQGLPVGEAASPGPSSAYMAFLRRRRRHRVIVLACQLALLVGLVSFWQFGARGGLWDPVLTSTPTTVWTTMVGVIADGTLWVHVWVTFKEIVISFAVGMLLGIAIAIAIWWSPLLSRILDPYLVILNAMPKIALGPILYIWLGASLSVYGMAIAISLIVTIIMAYTGFTEVDANKIKLLRTFGANRLQILQKVVLPGSVPTLVSTVKVNIGLTMVGVIVGEFLSSQAGLGFLILYGSQVFQMSLVMTAIVVLVIMSAVLYGAVVLLESVVVDRHRRS